MRGGLSILPIHGSISPRHSCFRIITDSDILYASCGSQEELEKWITKYLCVCGWVGVLLVHVLIRLNDATNQTIETPHTHTSLNTHTHTLANPTHTCTSLTHTHTHTHSTQLTQLSASKQEPPSSSRHPAVCLGVGGSQSPT